MRLWSLHPGYLDAKGIVALWREGLLAKNVLEGNTKGYKNHPQLNRFKNAQRPVDAINQYLAEVYLEAERRNYKFDKSKINWQFKEQQITVNRGQLDYEFAHLLRKLEMREKERYLKLQHISEIEIFEIFKIVKGGIEDWEIL